ncbi:hypothetical protein GCM10022247_60860 [Allokutzneria multivorans]|uniref:PE domain-containing protein n=1 Tax=Allokutzneria multivorans TaxID=1142134 RepID=A0ABP7TKP6_9PSEU
MSKQYVRVGGWRIDLDQIPSAIAAFKDALDDLRGLVEQGNDAAEVRFMGTDDVSKALAKEVSERHLRGRGAIWAAAQLRDELTKAVSSLETARRHYARVEDVNRRSVSGG